MKKFIEIPKNAREVLRIERQIFNGHDLINIRVFFDAGDGEMQPGRQGVAFRAALTTEVVEAIKKVAA